MSIIIILVYIIKFRVELLVFFFFSNRFISMVKRKFQPWLGLGLTRLGKCIQLSLIGPAIREISYLHIGFRPFIFENILCSSFALYPFKVGQTNNWQARWNHNCPTTYRTKSMLIKLGPNRYQFDGWMFQMGPFWGKFMKSYFFCIHG